MSENAITQFSRERFYTSVAGQVEFVVPFKFQQDEDLEFGTLDGDDFTKLYLGADYQVSGAQSDSGGTITLHEPALAEVSYRLRGKATLELTKKLTGAKFFVDTSNSLFERCLIWIAELARDTDVLRSLIEQLNYNNLAGAIYTADPIDEFIDGSRTSFELSYKSRSFATLSERPGNWIVNINGLTQYEGEAYTVGRSSTQTVINFTFAPKAGDNIQISYLRLFSSSGGSGNGGSDGGTGYNAVQIVGSLDEILDPYEGMIAFVETDGKLYIYKNGAWLPLSDLLTPNAPPSIPVVDALPATAAEGTIVALSTDGKLYIYRDGAWHRVVEEITPEAIQAGLFTYGLRPIEYYAGLPTEGNVEGRVVFNTDDNMMYMFVEGAWKNFADIYTPDTPGGVEIVSADPETGNYEGRVVFNTTLAQLRNYKDGDWQPVVMATQIGDNTITSNMIVANAITAGLIAAGAIGTDQLDAGAITADKIASEAVTSEKIQAGAVAANKIAAQAITGEKIAAGSITTAHLAADFVVAAEIQAGSIGATELAANAVTADKIASGQIVAGHLQSGTITADKIQANTIEAGNLKSGAVSQVATTVSSTRHVAVGSWVTIASVSMSCTSGAKRLIWVGTALSDETSTGVPNNDTVSVQGVYRITASGSTVVSYDSYSHVGTTTAHSYHAADTASRSGYVTFALQARADNFAGASRTIVGFRTPTITVAELKK